MKLVKVGDTWINMDQVVHIDDSGAEITIRFAGAIEGEIPYGVKFGDKPLVEALRSWLTQFSNADDVLLKAKPVPPMTFAGAPAPRP